MPLRLSRSRSHQARKELLSDHWHDPGAIVAWLPRARAETEALEAAVAAEAEAAAAADLPQTAEDDDEIVSAPYIQLFSSSMHQTNALAAINPNGRCPLYIIAGAEACAGAGGCALGTFGRRAGAPVRTFAALNAP